MFAGLVPRSIPSSASFLHRKLHQARLDDIAERYQPDQFAVLSPTGHVAEPALVILARISRGSFMAQSPDRASSAPLRCRPDSRFPRAKGAYDVHALNKIRQGFCHPPTRPGSRSAFPTTWLAAWRSCVPWLTRRDTIVCLGFEDLETTMIGPLRKKYYL